MKIIKKVLISLCLVLTMISFVTQSMAQEKEISITLNYEHGVCEFQFYRIADFDENTGFKLIAPFNTYTDTTSSLTELENLNSSQLRTLATTLAALVQRDQLTPTYTASTDENGTHTWNNAQEGVYLIIGEQTSDEQFLYTSAPLLAFVPITSGDEEGYNYNVVVDVSKVNKEEIKKEYIDYRVIKIWKDTENEIHRPTQIKVALLRDGIVYDQVTLSEENNWVHVWPKLSSKYNWSAVETDIPENYAMTVENEATGVVIINTYDGPPSTPPQDDLPLTGQLWWPVPVLIILGVTLLTIGEIQRKSRKNYPGGQK